MVPTRNRPAPLARLLEALRAQTYPMDRFEVIVVDDGGSVGLDEVLSAFGAVLRLSLLREPHRGCAGARHTGTLSARGSLLAFTDDDCRPTPGWIACLCEAARASPGAALGGRVENGRPESSLAEASQGIVNYFTGHENAGPSGPRYFPTNNLALPADGYRAVGGLDPDWSVAGGEDRDLCDRWARSGRPFRSVPDALVFHDQQLTPASFLEQHFGYGRGAALFRAVRGGTSKPEAANFAPWRFYARLPLLPLGDHAEGRALLVSVLLVASQFAAAAGFAFERLLLAVRGGSRRALERPR